MTKRHEYMAACTEKQYKQYGRLNRELFPHRIFTLGVHIPDGFQEDGKIYHHMLVVMSPVPLDNLQKLFPGITTGWLYQEKEETEQKEAKPLRVTQDEDALYVSSPRLSIRI